MKCLKKWGSITLKDHRRFSKIFNLLEIIRVKQIKPFKHSIYNDECSFKPILCMEQNPELQIGLQLVAHRLIWSVMHISKDFIKSKLALKRN